ncbi:hypothetical protein LOD99_8805 [Oopsacas minuta]|uniref:Tc1-like transposase DDE domain-containing protein n=1 Tax=Oopsacas minuta TaxID=111878 RepID=A0AAV7JGH0_9METZ|nr:hypothetical protein LOD99_8805 [Oopsacas minuta]
MIRSLLQSKQLSPKQISENVGISLATVYNVKARLDAVERSLTKREQEGPIPYDPLSSTRPYTRYNGGSFDSSGKCIHENNWRLVMDNDPKHTSRKVKVLFSQNVPKQIPWPSQSPGLNPIENLFGCVKQELIKLGPRSIPELKEKLEGLWNRIDPAFLRPYWESMTRRCQMAVDNDGYPITY